MLASWNTTAGLTIQKK